MSEQALSMAEPIIVGPIADSFMIQRVGLDQAGRKDAQWLTPKLTWSRNIFMAARFEPDQRPLAEQYLAEARTEDLPVFTDEQESAMA
ncbi:MAG: hypothetical protein Q8R32_03435 [bacterium]|nr:hypothetical protein [bacterium]